jgi:hypothetical protein
MSSVRCVFAMVSGDIIPILVQYDTTITTDTTPQFDPANG